MVAERELRLGTKFTADIKQFIRETDKLVNRLRRVNNRMQSMSRGARGFDKVARSVKGANEAIDRQETALARVRKEIRSSTTAWAGLQRAMKVVSLYGGASAAIYGVVNALRAGSQEIVDYDQALKNLQAITKSTDSQTEQMGSTIKDVAEKTKFSTGEVAEGMVLLGQAGFSATEAMQAMEATANLATGTLSDMRQTSDLLTTTVRAFQLQASEAGRVSDVMANAINRSKLTLEKLRIAFNFVGAAAAQTGLSLEETAASMMLLANNGLRASTIGTGLRQVLSRMLAPNRNLREEFQRMGINLDEVNPRLVGYQKAMAKMSTILVDQKTKTLDMGKAYRLFGLRGAQAAAVLGRAFLSGEYQRMLDTTYETGSAAEMAGIQMEGLGVKLKNLADRAKLVAVAIGEAGLTDILKTLVDILRILAKGLADFISSDVGKAIVQFGLWTTVIYGTIGAFRLLGFGIRFLGSKLGGLSKVVQTVTAATLGLRGAMTGAGAAGVASMGALVKIFPLVSAGVALAIVAINRWAGQLDRAIEKQNEVTVTAVGASDNLKAYAAALDDIKTRYDRGEDVTRRYSNTLKSLIEEYPELEKSIRDSTDAFDENIDAIESLQFKKQTEYMNSLVKEIDLYQKKAEQAAFRTGLWRIVVDELKASLEKVGKMFEVFLAGPIRKLLETDLGEGEFNRGLGVLRMVLKGFGVDLQRIGVNVDGFRKKIIETGRDSKSAKKATAELEDRYRKLAKAAAAFNDTWSTESILEGLRSLGASEEILKDIGAELEDLKYKLEDVGAKYKKELDALPDIFRDFYDSLDPIRKAEFLKVKDQMDKEIAAFEDAHKIMGGSAEDLYEGIAAIRSKYLVKFMDDMNKEKMSTKELAEAKIQMLEQVYEKEVELSNKAIEIKRHEAIEKRNAALERGDRDAAVEAAREYSNFVERETQRLQTLRVSTNRQTNRIITEQEKTASDERVKLFEEEADAFIKASEKRYQEIQRQTEKLNKDLADLDRDYFSDLRDIRQSTMTDLQKYNDDVREIGRLMNKGRIEEDVKYFQEARQLAVQLTGEVKNAQGEIVKSKQETARQAETLAEQAYQAEKDLIERQIRENERQLETLKVDISEIKGLIVEYGQTVDEAGRKKLELQTAEAIQKMTKAHNIVTNFKKDWDKIESKTVTLTVKVKQVGSKIKVHDESEGGDAGGGEEVEAESENSQGGFIKKRIGGLVRAAVRKFAGGGKLGGYGGGDTIKALLEPGEFVIRKEAVKKYGSAIFEALNAMNLDVPDFGIPKVLKAAGRAAFQTGGMVSDEPAYAGVRVDKIVVSPTYMTGDRTTAKRLAVDIKRELDALEARRGRR